jgi:hypothetical protein
MPPEGAETTSHGAQPDLPPYTKLEPVVREAEAVLMAGGEREPIPTRDPRVPQAGPAVEFSA